MRATSSLCLSVVRRLIRESLWSIGSCFQSSLKFVSVKSARPMIPSWPVALYEFKDFAQGLRAGFGYRGCYDKPVSFLLLWVY